MHFKQDVLKRFAEFDESDVVKILGDWNDTYNDLEPDKLYQIIVNEECNTTRFRSVHDLVFLDIDTQKYYHVQYERGLTEYQYYYPFDEYPEGIDCREVEISIQKRVVFDVIWKFKDA